MWQEDLTRQVGKALGHDDLVLVRAPASSDADWACALLPSQADPAELHLGALASAGWRDNTFLLTLTTAARGQVVDDILRGRAPAPAAARVDPTLRGMPDLVPAERLYPVRLAHARTAMLLRQGVGHGVLDQDDDHRTTLSRTWRELGSSRTETIHSRRLLLALAGSNRARDRSQDLGRSGPLRTNITIVAEAFEDVFVRTRFTPRGSPPPPGAAIMDVYRLNLALVMATALVLRTGLTDLGLTAPEYL